MSYEETLEKYNKKQKRAEKTYKVGRVLLRIASVLYAIDFFLIGFMIVYSPIAGVIHFNEPNDVVGWIFYIIQFVLVAVGSVAGFSYAKGKGPLIRFASLAAIVTLVISLAIFSSSLYNLLTNDMSLKEFLNALLLIGIDSVLYFVGWSLMKDKFD